MSRLVKALQVTWQFLKSEPALLAALLNIAVIALGYLGLHVTGEQLVYLAGIATALFGALVRAGVVPLSKTKK